MNSFLAEFAKLTPERCNSIDGLQRMLEVLPPGVPKPEITPNPNGTLTLDWRIGETWLSIEVGDKCFTAIWKANESPLTQEGILPPNVGDLSEIYFNS